MNVRCLSHLQVNGQQEVQSATANVTSRLIDWEVVAHPQVKGIPEIELSPHGLQGLLTNPAALRLGPLQQYIVPHLQASLPLLHTVPKPVCQALGSLHD